MDIKVGTFNLNNLFSRFNFNGEIEALQSGDTEVNISYTFNDPGNYRIRTFQGRLVKEKPAEERAMIASRILAMDVDVLAVQEVEDIGILRSFVKESLGGHYPYQVLVEGNDPRLIDLGILSRLPIGAISSWQYAVHPDDPSAPVFSRDLLEVEILNPKNGARLFTVYNNHLKSHFVPFNEDQLLGAERANRRRRHQAETAARIISARMRPNSRYIVLGDLNDPVDSEFLEPIIDNSNLGMVNALVQPRETRPPKPDNPMPSTTAWTHRFKPAGQLAQYELFDQIWLSPALAGKQTDAVIDRRTKHGGDGSDHDPAWIHLSL